MRRWAIVAVAGAVLLAVLAIGAVWSIRFLQERAHRDAINEVNRQMEPLPGFLRRLRAEHAKGGRNYSKHDGWRIRAIAVSQVDVSACPDDFRQEFEKYVKTFEESEKDNDYSRIAAERVLSRIAARYGASFSGYDVLAD